MPKTKILNVRELANDYNRLSEDLKYWRDEYHKLQKSYDEMKLQHDRSIALGRPILLAAIVGWTLAIACITKWLT